MTTIISAAFVIGITGLGCALVLAIAAKFFAVEEDPRIAEAASFLPGVNCGGCGYAGCADYAKAVALNGAPVNLCKPGGQDTLEKLAAFAGVQAIAAERCVAIVLCSGDDSTAIRKGAYNGIANCAAAELAGGGTKACHYGCIGFGSCARVCPVMAIEITRGNLSVVHPELCIGCGKCVAACPRKLIKLVPESRTIHILCSSRDRGPVTKKLCSVGCIGCTLCFKGVGGKGIRMEGPLAVVDYSVPVDNEEIIAKCPQHTIAKRPGLKCQDQQVA